MGLYSRLRRSVLGGARPVPATTGDDRNRGRMEVIHDHRSPDGGCPRGMR
jgi:hypothetical protein